MKSDKNTLPIYDNSEKTIKLLYNEHKQYVFNICFKFTGSADDSQDLLQEVFVEVYRSVKSFKGDCKITSWLYRIAATKSIDLIRSRKRKKRFAVVTSLFGFENEEEILPFEKGENPVNKFEENERFAVLLRFVNKLKEKQRIAFTLSQIDGLSYKEISEIMELSISSVESLIFRARKKLKEEITEFLNKSEENTSLIGIYRLTDK